MTIGDYAMLFPGQGSHSAGMLSGAYSTFPVFRDAFTEASDALGIDLWSITLDQGDSDSLNMTENTQPILLACSVGLWRHFLNSYDSLPAVLAGHSLGEFSALVCAQSIDFLDAIKLVRKRGCFMQEAVPSGVGAMAAILGLDDDIIDATCAEISGERSDHLTVHAVNYNSPGQVVVAGHEELVHEAINSLKSIGAKRAILLPVSAPFHTPLMISAGEKLALEIESIVIKEPKIPVLSNVDAAAHHDPDEIKKLIVKQTFSPVNWTGCMQTILDFGIKLGFECGPGTVLTGLFRRIDKSFVCRPLEKLDNFDLSLEDEL